MKNFKPGQMVVYKNNLRKNKNMSYPKNGEIVTLLYKCADHPEAWVIEGYVFAPCGNGQSYHEKHLFPIKDTIVTLRVSEIKLEPKKVIEKVTEVMPLHNN